MTRAALVFATLAALAAGGAGYGAGRGGVPAFAERARSQLSAWTPAAKAQAAPAQREGAIIYYADPDGKPAYAPTPTTTADGRAFRAVLVGEDVRFDADDSKPIPPDAMPAAEAPAVGRKVRYYRNPMGLPDTSPVPKTDAMGMAYVPVYADEASEPGTVTVPPGRLQRTGVRSAVVGTRVIVRPVRVPGTVQLDERRVTVVATRSDAFIDHVEDVTTGDRVRKGQPLVQVYSAEINAAAAQLIANPGFDGSRRRLQNLNVPADAIAQMERTRTVPMAITWAAPRDGIVLERAAVEGMRAEAGATLFRIADVSVVWVLADVPESAIGGVRPGQTATVRVRALPGRTFSGTVGLIYPSVERQTRTTRVRIELKNPDAVLRPDMYAEVAIATGSPEPVAAVPDDAVIDDGTRQSVLLERGEGRFSPRVVTTGARGDGWVEVLSGVAAGERVVVAANFLIDSESNLKAALDGLAAAESLPGPQAAETGR